MYIRFYELNSTFTFGKFSDKTLKEVIEIQPTYIDWCAINLGHFYIDYEVIKQIREFAPDFRLSKEGQRILNEKITEWGIERDAEDSEKLRQERIENRTSSKYGGAYGYDDDAIDSAFEGDPENYWNID